MFSHLIGPVIEEELMQMGSEKIDLKEAHYAFDATMKKMLDLGQACVPEHQFRAYRKMALAIFAHGKKCLTRTGQGQRRPSEPTAKGVVTMDG